MVQLNVISGDGVVIRKDDEPIATRTRLGWVVRGVLECDPCLLAARVHAVFGAAEEEVSADAVRRLCDTEHFWHGAQHCSTLRR